MGRDDDKYAFFFRSLVNDLELWYEKNYYPKDWQGSKPELEQHIKVLHDCFRVKEGENVQTARVRIFTEAQEKMNKLLLGEQCG